MKYYKKYVNALMLIFLMQIQCSRRNDFEKEKNIFFEKLEPIDVPNVKNLSVNNFDSYEISFPRLVENNGVCGIFVEKALLKGNFTKDSIGFIRRSLAIRLLNDSCNIHVGDRDRLPIGCNKSNYIPVPSIHKRSSELKNFDVPESSMIVLLKFEKRIMFKEQYEFPDIGLPENLKHGYSNGVVLTVDKRIIHWLIVW